MSNSIKVLSQRALLALLVALVFGIAPEAYAQTGSCTAATGDAYFDGNNVRARILTNGNLFWRGDPYVYEVPKGGGVNAVFAGGFWIGGLVGGQLRVAAARYGNYEFWGGPIDESGNPPADCSEYDRIWKINRSDIQAVEAGGAPTLDLASWPTGLGAPTLAPAAEDGIDNDGDGEIDEVGEMKRLHEEILQQPLSQRIDRVIDLAAGERPEMYGDQMLWWIMNDRGNTHNETETPPIGVEVHAMVFGFNQSGDIGNTTFYRVNVFMKATNPLEEAYVALFSDPDLGDFQDDYVGSDSTLGIGYVYNSDNDDAGGYGPNPPALGYDFFQGPIVPSVGDTALVAGRDVPDFRNLPMTSFVYYNNGGGLNEDPQVGSDYYNYFRARWKDGRPIKAFGDGFNVDDPSIPDAKFMYPGDPVQGEFWSEVNTDGEGSANEPADRRFVMSSGPFTVNPGDQQEIVYGIVWARGDNYLDSVDKMRAADRRAQAAFDVNFVLPQPPDPPQVTFTPLDRQVVLEWTNAPTSNNYLDSYREFNPLGDPDQPDYIFEGYEIVRYSSALDQQGTVIATYDVPNGVTQIIDDINEDGITELTTRGTDSGVQHAHVVSGLTNYQTYYFGVRAYAYNEGSIPKAFYSPVTRAAVVPAQSSSVLSEAAVEAARTRGAFDIVAERTAGVGDGVVSADVVNPAAVRNADYRVEFYSLPAKAPATVATVPTSELEAVDFVQGAINQPALKTPGGETTYDVFRGETKIFDGSATGEPAPLATNLFVADGLEFTVAGPPPNFKNFLVTANAAGPLDPPDFGAFAFNNNGFPTLDGGPVTCTAIPSSPDPSVCNDRPSAGQQVGGDQFGINTGAVGATGGFATFDYFIGRVTNGTTGNFNDSRVIVPFDFEMRFTEEGSVAYDPFCTGFTYDVPFELWRVGVGTPDDPSDDVRMVPYVLDNDFTSVTGHDGLPAFNLMTEASIQAAIDEVGGVCGAAFADHPVSGAANDPQTDWVYWATPTDDSPGDAGYRAWEAAAIALGGGDDGTFYNVLATDNSIRRMVLVNFNGGDVGEGVYDMQMPETGTVFRIVTNKPNQPGDVHEFSTAGLGAEAPSAALQEERLEDIGVVPNPYRGASSYEVSQLTDEVRFTNLPDVATIRVFTLNGTLVRTLQKNSPGRRELSWDLTTEESLPLASGMYLIHVEVPNVGEHVIKFGVIKKRIQLNVF